MKDSPVRTLLTEAIAAKIGDHLDEIEARLKEGNPIWIHLMSNGAITISDSSLVNSITKFCVGFVPHDRRRNAIANYFVEAILP